MPEMRVDHPFLYAIVHEPTGAILVLGKLARPEGKALDDAPYPVERAWRNPKDPLPPGSGPNPPGPPSPVPPVPPPRSDREKGEKKDG